jgi:hypothetical protein
MRGRNANLNPLRTVLAALLLLAPWAIPASAQTQQDPQQSSQTDASSPTTQQQTDEKTDDTSKAKPATNQAMTPEEARQAQFLADSQKLYQLAQELKAEVAKSDKNTLSIAVTKKAEEIEKLAKSLKERMRKE